MKRILILESNEAFAAELADRFAQSGYEVCGVTGDGAEGLKLLEKTSPTLVIVSLFLKTCDGLTVLEAARAQGRKLFSPIISITGFFRLCKRIAKNQRKNRRIFGGEGGGRKIIGRISEVLHAAHLRFGGNGAIIHMF